MNKNAYVQRLTNEIIDPLNGCRLPPELGSQRTAIIACHANSRTALKGATLDMVLCRDSVFPVWSETLFDNETGRWTYSATWGGDQYTATDRLFIGGTTTTDYRDFNKFALMYTVNGANTTSTYSHKINTTFPCPAGIPFGKFVDDDQKDGWLYVPSDQASLACSFSLGRATGVQSATVTPLVFLEWRQGPDSPVLRQEVTIGTIAEREASTGAVISKYDVVGGQGKGAFVRVSHVRLEKSTGTASVFFADDWRPMVCLTVSSATDAQTVVSDAAQDDPDFPTISFTTGTRTAPFMPLLNMHNTRSGLSYAANMISRANRVVGVSLVVDNTTSVMNMEGEMLCTCYAEGRGTLLKPPDDNVRAAILDFDKMSTRLSNTVFAFARPGREISTFQDSDIQYEDPNNATNYLPCINLYKMASYSVLSARDLDTGASTSLLLTLRMSMEFITDDILLHPMFAGGTIDDLHRAVQLCHRYPPFRIVGRTAERQLVSNRSLGVRASGPRPKQRPPQKTEQMKKGKKKASGKPKPKPAPKPAASQQGTGGRGRGQRPVH